MGKINARNKGNTYERVLSEKFRNAGYTECVTSRSESKRTDDKGIDLCYTGDWMVQAKAQERLNTGLHEVLKSMPDGDKVVFWKRNNKGTVVAMPEELFWKIDRLLKEIK